MSDCLVHCFREILSGKKTPIPEEEEKVMVIIEKIQEKRQLKQKGPTSRPRKEILDFYRVLWELLPEAKDYYGYEKLYIPSDKYYLYTDVLKDLAQMIHQHFFLGKESYLPTIIQVPKSGIPVKAISLPNAEGMGQRR